MSKFVVEYGKDTGPATLDGRLDAPAFHRNHGPIRDVLARHLAGRQGDAIEIASGTGQHVVAFANAFPRIVWWPTDIRPAHLASIAAWRAESGLANIMAPAALDVTQAPWRAGEGEGPASVAAIVCINMLHIAPWATAEGLIEGTGRRLAPGGHLFIYGPFARDGAHVSQSNIDFDASLRRQDPSWGVRDTRDVAAAAAAHGLRFVEAAAMPSNNFTLVFEKGDRS